jgi:ABC-type sugar transport system permease subunit
MSNDEARWGVFLVTPSLIFFLVFILVPVALSFWLGFHKWDPLRPMSEARWIGLDNFVELVTDRAFLRTAWNTFVFVVGSVSLMLIGSMSMALCLNAGLRASTLYRGLFYSPVVTSLVATAVIWLWIFDPQFGFVNNVLREVGIPQPKWTASKDWAMPTIIITFVWREVGYFTVIYLAALQGVPEELKEAAKIDGASPLQVFRRITIPLLMPATLFVLVLGILRATQNSFAVVYVMTSGGPVNATNVLVVYLFQYAFEFFRMGFASAVSLFVFVLIFGLSLIQFRLIGRRTELL